MRVCLIASNSINVSPYVKRYMSLLSTLGIEFDVIQKRSRKEISDSYERDEFTYYYSEAKTPLGKINRFISYGLFVRKILQQCNYDKVVLFSAVNSLFCFFLSRKYLRKKYIVDIRDYDPAIRFPIVNTLFKNCVNNADFIVVSSKKFLEWIPSYKHAVVMHNLSNNGIWLERTDSFKSNLVTIGYLGGIGYYEQNVALVNSLGNNPEYSIVYHGKYPAERNIADYCKNRGFNNVYFFGAYDNEEKHLLYKDIDLINAIYGNSSLVVTTALPNKLYDCICYKIPIIVSKGTFLSEIVEEYKIGISIDIEKDDIDSMIRSFIQQFDSDGFVRSCASLYKSIELEQSITDEQLISFFVGEK